jgi:hypothetical protein
MPRKTAFESLVFFVRLPPVGRELRLTWLFSACYKVLMEFGISISSGKGEFLRID